MIIDIGPGMLKMRDLKMTDQYARHKNAGPEIAGPKIAGHENAGPEITGHENAEHENALWQLCLSVCLMHSCSVSKMVNKVKHPIKSDTHYTS